MGKTTVTLERADDATLFSARNAQGFEILVDDATARPDGVGRGAGPMQLLLMGLAGCAAVDVVSILTKARQRIDAFRIEAQGERPDGAHPAPYTAMHLDFSLDGDLAVDRVERAIRLSMEKYCSAAATLRRSARITASFSVNGTRYPLEDLVLGPDPT